MQITHIDHKLKISSKLESLKFHSMIVNLKL